MKRQKITFILLLTAVVVSGALFSFYAKSRIASINSLRSSIKSFDRVRDVSDVKDTGEIRNLKELFPEKANIAGFIENIYPVSKKYSVKNLTFEQKGREFIELNSGKVLKDLPATGQKTKLLYSYPVKVNFNSDYRNMAEFVRVIQNQERLVTIDSLTVKRDKETLAVEMAVHIYSTEEK